MSAKTSLRDESRDLGKQIGCMNGIFQIFDRHHFLTGRRISSRSNKRLLQGSQHQQDRYATKTVTVKEVEVQREKPRMSTESSRASFSSSSCSSTFSSLDTNKTAQAETLPRRQINVPESQFQSRDTTKEDRPSSAKGVQSHDIRDVVKDSMYREARSLSIKSTINDERGTVMKHIDSPRPPQQSKIGNSKATGHVGSPRVLAKVPEGAKHSKDERLTLHRFSYDGRESREIQKSSMKHKEFPRLSLDSKTSTMKALESRRDLHVGDDASYQESETNRTSSVVAKLMGLDILPDTPTRKAFPKEDWLSELTSKPEENSQNQVNYSPHVSPASPSSKLQSPSFVRKPITCSRLEPAPWRQQDSSQGSPKMALKNRKAPASILHQTSSVYGEIEKRITELEFKKSGKDLRALKQILEAMQKTRERLEDQQGDPTEFTLQRRCSSEDRKAFHQVPSIKGPFTPKQSGTVVVMKPAKVMDKAKTSVTSRGPTMEIPHLQRLQTRSPRYKGGSAHCQNTNDLTPEGKNVRYRNSRGPQHRKSENCTTPGRSSGTVSPRLQRSLLTIEGQSHSTTLSSDAGRVKKQGGKKVTEKGSLNRRVKLKAKDQQLCDDQLSELSSDTRYSSYQGDTASVKSESNNSLVSQTETEIISMVHSINTAARQKQNSASTTTKHMAAVESPTTMLEQPSPISVLDDAFYCEDSPSPVKKISTVFQDESPSPDEAEWHLETLNHLTDGTRSNHCLEYTHKLGNMENSGHGLTLLSNGPAANHDGNLTPDHRYINKILLTSGLLKDSSFISATEQLVFSHHLINPEMFDVLEQTEEIREAINRGVAAKNVRMKLNNRIQRKIVFDMVDEILVQKITSGGPFTAGRKGTSPQGLLKEVYLEMDRVCRIPECNLDEEDEMIRLLTADMMHQSDDWVSCSGEVPALVLGVERLIFKDLINELITGEVTDSRDMSKRHRRKLFSN